MKKLSVVMLLLALAAQGALAYQPASDSADRELPQADAVASAKLDEAQTLLNRKTAEMIEKHVDEANRKLDVEMDRRISGKLKVSLLD
jgi:hypothetical protein